MKAAERHQLKQNEFAQGALKVASSLSENRRSALMGLGAFVLVVVIAGGYLYAKRRGENHAGAALGIAMATLQSQVVPASTLPGVTQQPGTFPTDKARLEAALTAFRLVTANYAGTTSGLQAGYQAGSALMALGRFDEAQTEFKAVADRAGSSLLGPMARLGVAQALLGAGKNDDGIKALTDLAAERDGVLPVDGVLMELGRACLKAGKTQEARAAFKRVVDEFPQSVYTSDARQRVAALN